VATPHHPLIVSDRQMQMLATRIQRTGERNDLERANKLGAACLTSKTQGHLAQAADHACDPAGLNMPFCDTGRKGDQ